MPLPAMVLDAPNLPPTPPGLIQAATGPLPMPAHLITSGGRYRPDSCGDVHQAPTPCEADPGDYPGFDLDTAAGETTVYSFYLYASEVCGQFGVSNAEAERRVRSKLIANENRGVERAFWGGADGQDGILEKIATAGGVTTLADSATVVEAISLLEQTGAENYGGQLTLHMRPRLAAYAGGVGTPDGADRPARTRLGSQVVFGYGYSGTGPAGEAVGAADEYVFATGRVVLWRGDVWVSPPDQLLDRSNNQRGLYAIRPYALAVECFVATTQVTRA